MTTLWRQFTTKSDCQTWCDQQTLAANLPPSQVTQKWSEPFQLADGSWVAISFNDPAASEWKANWQWPVVF